MYGQTFRQLRLEQARPRDPLATDCNHWIVENMNLRGRDTVLDGCTRLIRTGNAPMDHTSPATIVPIMVSADQCNGEGIATVIHRFQPTGKDAVRRRTWYSFTR